APQRIDGGMQNLMSQDERVWSNNSTWTSQNNQWMTKMRVWSDYASYQWQSKGGGYNAQSQRDWLSKLGQSSGYSSIIVLLGSIERLILAYGLRIYLKARQAQAPFDRAIKQLNQSLADDLKKQPAETFHHWLQRLSQQVKVENQSAFIEAIRIFE